MQKYSIERKAQYNILLNDLGDVRPLAFELYIRGHAFPHVSKRVC